MVWLRQSAAHNWPVTSTQQDSFHAQTRQESTRPFGIYKYLSDSLCLLQKQESLQQIIYKRYPGIWWRQRCTGFGGGVCRSKVATTSHRVPGWALSLGSAKHLDSTTSYLILLVEELHLVACGQRAKVRMFHESLSNSHALSLPPPLFLAKRINLTEEWQLWEGRENTTLKDKTSPCYPEITLAELPKGVGELCRTGTLALTSSVYLQLEQRWLALSSCEQKIWQQKPQTT